MDEQNVGAFESALPKCLARITAEARITGVSAPHPGPYLCRDGCNARLLRTHHYGPAGPFSRQRHRQVCPVADIALESAAAAQPPLWLRPLRGARPPRHHKRDAVMTGIHDPAATVSAGGHSRLAMGPSAASFMRGWPPSIMPSFAAGRARSGRQAAALLRHQRGKSCTAPAGHLNRQNPRESLLPWIDIKTPQTHRNPICGACGNGE